MTKISLSDILRHIITGALFLLFFIWNYNISINQGDGGEWSVWMIVIVICYPLGIAFQSINRSLEDYAFKNNKLQFLKKYFIKLRCYSMKNGDEKDVPEWIQTSSQPEKVVECVEMEIENKKNANINEYYYFCEFFQGLLVASSIAIILFLVLFLCSYIWKPIDILSGSNYIINIIILVVIGLSSYKLACLYARKFIVSLDAYKEVLNINIDKYMHKFGVQRVFIMMRTHRNTPKEYLEDSIGSVFKQDYYDINLVILEDNKEPGLKEDIYSICDKYKEKQVNVHLLYYYQECGNPATASYAIRNIILKTADRDDDIIFILDDDDMFAHKHVISDVVFQMNNKKAQICLIKYNIIGEPERNISRNGGSTHNNITSKLCKQDKAYTIEDMPCLCFAASLGWSKTYRMETLRKYFLMINETKEEKKVKEEKLQLISYEDFPDFLAFLIPETRITGLNEPAYLYRKHDRSATQNITKEAFQEWRIDQLRLLTFASACNSKILIKEFSDYLDLYLTVKECEIKNIIGKYHHEGKLTDYTEKDFDKDLLKFKIYRNEYCNPYLFLKDCMDENRNQFNNCNFSRKCLKKKFPEENKSEIVPDTLPKPVDTDAKE